jgi:inhibitor of cysteine peptidase
MTLRFGVRIVARIVLLVTIVLVTACRPTEEDGPADRVVIGENSNGEQVEILLGGTLVAILDSNPSTGYIWEIEEVDENMLRQIGDIEFRSSIQDNPPPGTGGTSTIRFEAISEGESELRLIHHRPWEDQEPLATVSVQVVVR